MASKRLTNSLRTTIVDKLISRTFPEKYQALKIERGKWLEEYIKQWHGGHEAIRDQMPERAKVLVIQRQIRFGEHYSSRSYLDFQMEHAQHVFHDFPDDHTDAAKMIKKLTDLGVSSRARVKKLDDELHDHKKAYDKVAAEEARARADAKAILGSVSTYKALLDVWPELKEIIGDDQAPTPVKALVKNIGPLNNTFRLPTPRVANKKPLKAK